jgi:hypothetical protein
MTDTKIEKTHPLARQMARLQNCITDLNAAVTRKNKDEIADVAQEGDKAWMVLTKLQRQHNSVKGLSIEEDQVVCDLHTAWNASRFAGITVTGQVLQHIS